MKARLAEKYKNRLRSDDKFRNKMYQKRRDYAKTTAGKLSDLASKSKRRSKLNKQKFPKKEWLELIKLFDGFCPYCQTRNNKLTLDHIVPVSKGGTNHIDNLMPACRACNLSKSNKSVFDWNPNLIDSIVGALLGTCCI